MISTHAPLAGRDQKLTHPSNHLGEISTHAPLAGRDGKRCCLTLLISVFQPTRPLRGATVMVRQIPVLHLHFNPRAPCGARHRRRPQRKR